MPLRASRDVVQVRPTRRAWGCTMFSQPVSDSLRLPRSFPRRSTAAEGGHWRHDGPCYAVGVFSEGVRKNHYRTVYESERLILMEGIAQYATIFSRAKRKLVVGARG
jgi:hypothetical protein